MQRSLPHVGNVTPQFDIPWTPLSTNRSINSSTLTLPTSARGTREKDEIINNYLEDTRLIAVVEGLMKDFANSEELPYNPFPELARQARSHAERFHMFARENSAAVDKIENELVQDGSYTAHTQDSPTCWGLPSLLCKVNSECLVQFDWLLSKMNTNVTTHNSEDYSYIIQKPVPVLLGPCVFTGTLYPEPVENVDIRMEYAISGPYEHEAAEMFANAVLADIQMMLEAEVHILLGVTVPRIDKGNQELWTRSGLEERQDQFLASIKSAAVFHKMPVVKCMFQLQPDTRQYRRGFKQYNLNFIRTSEEGSVSTSTHPYLSAHEGVFVSHYDIKEYLSWFVNVDTAVQPLTRNLPTTTRNQGVTGKSKRNRANLQSSSQSQDGNRTLNQNTGSIGNNPARAPNSEEVISTIKRHFSERIFELDRQNEFFKMLNYVVLLLLLNRESSEFSESFSEACGLFKSTAYQLHVVIQQNIALQDLVEVFSSCGNGASGVVQNHFLAYRQSMKDVFSNTLKERSRDLLVWGKVLLKLLDSMTVINPHMEGKTQTGTLPLTSEVVGGLRALNRYCETVLLRLLDDALSNCSHLVKYFPPVENGGGFVVQQSYKHGAERLDIINQYKMVLNVADQAKRIAAPSSIARETVVLQYFMDSRIDQVFHEFLVDVVTDARFIPPNPYPRLVSQLTLAATRMELFGERRSRLLSKLISGSVQRLDSQNFVCHLPGVEAYGVVSAIAALDGKSYSSLRAKIHCLCNKINPRTTVSGFKTLVDVAISGFGPLFGRLMPYLHQLELEEHYFVQGPRNARTEAIHNFTKVVYEHLEEFSEMQDVLFIGFFLGGESFRRGLHDILPTQRKKAFLAQLLAAVKSKQPVYMKVYLKLDWRFIVVKKSFLLHFIDTQSFNYERYYNVSSDPVAFYQNVFSKQDVALLYARCCGPQDHTDPCKGENLALSLVHVDHYIVRATEEENLLAVYRWLMLKSLMNQHKSYVTEAWCMFHSSASQLEYLCTLNRTVQSLVNEELSRAFRPLLEEDERTSLLDPSALCTMVTAYSDKLERVLSRGTVMAPSGLLPRLRAKLRLITPTDPVSRSLPLVISPQTPVILQEINEMLQPLIDAAAYNVHVTCPEIHSAIKSVEADLSGRNSKYAPMQK